MKDEKSVFFIDIFGGETDTITEDEWKEKEIEAQPLVEFYNKQYGPSKEQLELEEENKHILKTRMRLHRETIHVSYVQSFGDNYHREKGDITTEDEQEARTIKRRYPRYTDYCEALMIYSDYMQKLYDKYGGKDMFELLEKYGKIPEYIPPEPKIKPTAVNKSLKKHNILLSPKSKNKDNFVDAAAMSIEQICELLNVTIDPNEELEIKRFDKDKAKKSTLEMLEESNKGNNRFAKIRDRAMLNGGMDFIMDYFDTKSKYEKEKERSESYDENVTLQDLLDDNFITEEDLQNNSDEMIWYNGMMIKKSVVEEDAIYRKLGDYGWNIKKVYRSITENNRGIAYELLKRADKKEKKKRKKEGKKNKVKDDFMTTLIFDSKYDNFSDFQDDMMNMTAANIFGEDFNDNIK